MNMAYFKKLTAALIVSVCTITPAFASITGGQALGNATISVDAWVAVCPPLYKTLEAQVDNLNPNLGDVFMTVGTRGQPTTQIRDTNPALNVYSTWVKVAGDTSVPFILVFKKSVPGVIGFQGRVQCRGSLGVFNPVEFYPYINQ